MTIGDMRIRYIVLTLSVTLGIASPGNATDGVLEINQACAINTGCFAGDSLGFPVRISNPGSYILTSNLTVNLNQSAIEVGLNVDNVTLDLNGFTLTGPTSNNGIQLSRNKNVEIRDGTIREFNNGVQVSSSPTNQVRIINLRVHTNANIGLHLVNSDETEIRNCSVIGNGAGGIAVGENSLVIGSLISGNGGFGVAVGAGSGYGGNLVNGNAGTLAGGVEIAPNICNGSLICP